MLHSVLKLHHAKPSLRATRAIATGSIHDVIARGAPIDVHPEVQDALAHHKPIVALETTIVTHGLPHPVNLETAISVERIVRKNGAVPATIGIIAGRVKIGLSPDELEHLANIHGPTSPVKVSRRDIGPAISLKRDGGTTCSSTLIFAAMAGIKVFATGGLGGVHRGGEHSMDVSADLQELTRCSVGLVSAGVKSILDIGRTLEYLETQGVPVVSYGPSNDFPAFYTRHSGFKAPWHVNDPTSAADILRSQQQLGLTNGTVFAVPIPEEHEQVGRGLQKAVEIALREAERNGISRQGKEVTPWLLQRVSELTQGRSLSNNVALIQNTARVGAQIAGALSRDGHNFPSDPSESSALNSISPAFGAPPPHKTSGNLVIVGSSAVDITSKPTADAPLASHTTVPGSVSMTLGGVARNIAEAAHRTLCAVSPLFSDATILVSSVGPDSFGRLLLEETKRMGMRADGLFAVPTGQTAVCNMILSPAGDLVSGVADMSIVQTLDAHPFVDQIFAEHAPGLVALDGNLSESTLATLVRRCNEKNIPVLFEPTSVAKSSRILPAVATSVHPHPPVAFASPNLLELAQLYESARSIPYELAQQRWWWDVIEAMGVGSHFRLELEQLSRRGASDHDASRGSLSFLSERGVAQMAIHLLPLFQHLIIKCGDLGVLTVFRAKETTAWAKERSDIDARQIVLESRTGDRLVIKHFPALPLDMNEIVSVTGAGDTFVGTILATLLRSPHAFENPATLTTLIRCAQEAAVETLRSQLAVSPLLSQPPSTSTPHGKA